MMRKDYQVGIIVGVFVILLGLIVGKFVLGIGLVVLGWGFKTKAEQMEKTSAQGLLWFASLAIMLLGAILIGYHVLTYRSPPDEWLKP